MSSKNYKGLDTDGMPLKDQWKLEDKLRKFKYQVKIQHQNGRIRYVHGDEKKPIELYAKFTKSKILWIKEL